MNGRESTCQTARTRRGSEEGGEAPPAARESGRRKHLRGGAGGGGTRAILTDHEEGMGGQWATPSHPRAARDPMPPHAHVTRRGGPKSAKHEAPGLFSRSSWALWERRLLTHGGLSPGLTSRGARTPGPSTPPTSARGGGQPECCAGQGRAAREWGAPAASLACGSGLRRARRPTAVCCCPAASRARVTPPGMARGGRGWRAPVRHAQQRRPAGPACPASSSPHAWPATQAGRGSHRPLHPHREESCWRAVRWR